MLTCGLVITIVVLVQISQVFDPVGIHPHPKTRRQSWETAIPAMTDITSLAPLEASMMDMVWEGPRFILIPRKPRGGIRGDGVMDLSLTGESELSGTTCE